MSQNEELYLQELFGDVEYKDEEDSGFAFLDDEDSEVEEDMVTEIKKDFRR